MRILPILAASVAVGAIAVPAAAQSAYSYQSYPVQQQQSYPGYQQSYPQQGYGYANQNQTGASVIGQLVDSLLGNRYSVSDRTAVSQCASAAMAQASSQYSGYGGANSAYRQGYGYAQQGYAQQGYAQPALRVTSITDVQRRYDGLRVKGTIGTGYASQYGQYGNQYGYQNRGYGDLSFRCNVASNGAVTGLRVSPTSTRRY